jgi:hypothetical protein
MNNKGNRLGNEQVLGINDYLQSPNGNYKLLLHQSGCLELFCTINNQIFWHSSTFSEDIDAVRMQNNGNLVIYHRGGTNAAWASNTKDKGGDYIELQNDGNLVMYKKDGTAVWRTGTYGQQADMLLHLDGDAQYEQTIRKSEDLFSANGKYKLQLTAKGNLELRQTKTNNMVWESGTSGKEASELRMQNDGNLVLYKGTKADAVWATGTYGKGAGARLVLENYGQLVLFAKDGHIIWTSHTIDTSNWMAALDGTLSLKQICIPGSHDAGMYFAEVLATREDAAISSEVATYFGKGIAQTQSKNIYEQLISGVRYFDLRPKWYKGDLYMYHGPAYGPKLTEVLADINKFMNDTKEETIILNFSHFEGFNETVDGTLGEAFVALLTSSIKQEHLFDVEKYRHAAGTYTYDRLFEFPLSTLRGKIILLIENNSAIYNKAVTAKNRKGIYFLRKNENINAADVYTVHIFDDYANKEDYRQMADHQKEKFGNFDNNDELFLLNWTLTTNQEALINDIRAVTGTKGTAGVVISALSFIVNPGLYIVTQAANLPAIKSTIDPHSVETFARQVNHRLLGDRAWNDFVFTPNSKGKMVNIINTDYVESVHGVRACLRVMHAS